jgi:hypothetical protein
MNTSGSATTPTPEKRTNEFTKAGPQSIAPASVVRLTTTSLAGGAGGWPRSIRQAGRRRSTRRQNRWRAAQNSPRHILSRTQANQSAAISTACHQGLAMSRCGERRKRRNGVDCSGPRFDGGDPSLRSSSCSLRAPRRPSWIALGPNRFGGYPAACRQGRRAVPDRSVRGKGCPTTLANCSGRRMPRREALGPLKPICGGPFRRPTTSFSIFACRPPPTWSAESPAGRRLAIASCTEASTTRP